MQRNAYAIYRERDPELAEELMRAHFYAAVEEMSQKSGIRFMENDLEYCLGEATRILHDEDEDRHSNKLYGIMIGILRSHLLRNEENGTIHLTPGIKIELIRDKIKANIINSFQGNAHVQKKVIYLEADRLDSAATAIIDRVIEGTLKVRNIGATAREAGKKLLRESPVTDKKADSDGNPMTRRYDKKYPMSDEILEFYAIKAFEFIEKQSGITLTDAQRETITKGLNKKRLERIADPLDGIKNAAMRMTADLIEAGELIVSDAQRDTLIDTLIVNSAMSGMLSVYRGFRDSIEYTKADRANFMRGLQNVIKEKIKSGNLRLSKTATYAYTSGKHFAIKDFRAQKSVQNAKKRTAERAREKREEEECLAIERNEFDYAKAEFITIYQRVMMGVRKDGKPLTATQRESLDLLWYDSFENRTANDLPESFQEMNPNVRFQRKFRGKLLLKQEGASDVLLKIVNQNTLIPIKQGFDRTGPVIEDDEGVDVSKVN